MCDDCFAHGDGQERHSTAGNSSIMMLQDTDRPRFLDEFSIGLLQVIPAVDHAVHLDESPCMANPVDCLKSMRACPNKAARLVKDKRRHQGAGL